MNDDDALGPAVRDEHGQRPAEAPRPMPQRIVPIVNQAKEIKERMGALGLNGDEPHKPEPAAAPELAAEALVELIPNPEFIHPEHGHPYHRFEYKFARCIINECDSPTSRRSLLRCDRHFIGPALTDWQARLPVPADWETRLLAAIAEKKRLEAA